MVIKTSQEVIDHILNYPEITLIRIIINDRVLGNALEEDNHSPDEAIKYLKMNHKHQWIMNCNGYLLTITRKRLW